MKKQVKKINLDECVMLISQKYPVISDEINELKRDDLFYMAIGTLAQYCNERMEAKDYISVAGTIAFATTLYGSGDNEVQNAIGVSFVEHLQFESEKQAREFLSPYFYDIWWNWHNLA